MRRGGNGTVMAWFPTLQWFTEFGTEINKNDDFGEKAKGWGEEFNGNFLFHVHNLPTDEHTLSELPDELLLLRRMPEEIWEEVPDEIERQLLEQAGDKPVYDVFPYITDEIRRELPQWLHDVLTEAEELFEIDPCYDDVPENLSDELRSILPTHLSTLLYQLEEFTDDEGNVYAYLAIEDGKCKEVDVLDTPEERDYGYKVIGHYDSWESFIRNDKNIIEMVMRGELEPRGDITILLEYSDALNELGETVEYVETDYIFERPSHRLTL